MLPLGFSNLADSPTIVLSPHQHQFDPISSRAAHSIYNYQQPCKPLMPVRHWDHPLARSKAARMEGSPATKRSHDEVEEDENLDMTPAGPEILNTTMQGIHTSPPSMSSAAAHSFPYHQTSTQDVLAESWDRSAVTSRPVSITGSSAQKRSRDEVEAKVSPDISPVEIGETCTALDTAMGGTATALVGQSDNDEQALEGHIQDGMFGTGARSPSKRQRQISVDSAVVRPPSPGRFGGREVGTPASECEANDVWVKRLGLGWTTANSDLHERGIFDGLAVEVRRRFLLNNVIWLAYSQTAKLCLASTDRGWCFFPGTLDQCWVVGRTEEEALQRLNLSQAVVKQGCMEGCDELYLIEVMTESGRQSRLASRQPGQNRLPSPPNGWAREDFLLRLYGVHGSRSCQVRGSEPMREENMGEGLGDQQGIDPRGSDWLGSADSMDLSD